MKKNVFLVCMAFALLAAAPAWAQVFLPYDATDVSDAQKKSNPSRLAYPTQMSEQIKQDVAQRCGCSRFGIGEFSVSDTKKVSFSAGNLQYQASTKTYRFAEHQWDKVGDATDGTVYEGGVKSNNANISSTYSGWIDLFGWGTGNEPTKTSQQGSDYVTFVDWGTNPIINGGNEPDLWRTLTDDEWAYLLRGRANASVLFATGTVNQQPGLILLPDNWKTPAGQVFYPSTTKGLVWQHGSFYANEQGGNFYHNTYTAEQWQVMEQAGAVFLPGCGYREGKQIQNYIFGHYNSSTKYAYKENTAFYTYFCAMYVGASYTSVENYNGKSVRLVCDPDGGTDEPVEPQEKTLSLKLSTTNGGSIVVLDFFDKPDTVRVGYTLTLKKSGTNITFVVNLKALPNDGYSFTQWSDGNTDNPRTVTVTEDMTLSASFAKSGGSGGKGIGTFSVSDTKKVTFSPGNLQYQASTNTWRFAENQWDYIGDGNKNISPTYSGWIDLFGWGTGDAPTKLSTSDGDYSTFTDWGTNPISNGGNTPNQWRTLTKDEWAYLLDIRSTSSGIRYAKATVGTSVGVILLPDDWSESYYKLTSTNTSDADFTANQISQSDWTNMFESHDAVFLICSGRRDGTSVSEVGTVGYYWSSTYGSNDYPVYGMSIFGEYIGSVTTHYRYGGFSVRLVSEL